MNCDKQKIIYLAVPRGFCAGVRRSIEMVKNAIRQYGAPVYVKHQIVHNKFVVESLKAEGVCFIEDLEKADPNRPLIFSAHGVSPTIEKDAIKKGFKIVIDSTCPLVKRLHKEAEKYSSSKSRVLILAGKRAHPEVEGIVGHIKSNKYFVVTNSEDVSALPDFDDNVSEIVYLSQTTLSPEKVEGILYAIKVRYSDIRVKEISGICYASKNRQNAVKKMAPLCEKIIVLGSASSSNAQELVALASKYCKGEVIIIDTPEEVGENWLKGILKLGITSAASTPEILVDKLLESLRKKGWENVHEIGAREPAVVFKI